jgi:Na+/H+-translocating membrane pyrophosphatase
VFPHGFFSRSNSGAGAAPADHAVTELALILGIQAAGLAFAVMVARSLFSDDQESPRFQRVASALARATSAVMTRAGRDVLLGVGALGSISCLVHAYLKPAGSLLSAFQSGVLATLGLLFGAAFGGLAAYAALRIGVRASVRVTLGSRTSLDRALSIAIRAGGASALIGDALSLLGFAALFGIAFALKGGTALAPAAALQLGQELTGVLAGFALGGALTALVVQRAAGTYRTASEVAASLAGELEAGVSRDDPRNPALVGGVAGTLLAGHAASVALAFTLSSASHLCTLSIAARAVEAGAPAASLFIPFVARAFFSLASAFALLVVRTEEMKSPSLALLRGHASAAMIGSIAVAGSALWLMREAWAALTLAGLVGVSCSMLGALTTWMLAARRKTPELALLGGEVGSAASDARTTGLLTFGSVGKGLEAALLPVALLGPIAWWCARTAADNGAVPQAVVALVGWSALVGMLPLSVAAGCAGATALSARLVSGLTGGDTEAQRRLQRLSDARLSVASPRAQFLLVAAGTALVAAVTVPGLAARATHLAASVLDPVVLWSGALGSALVLAYAGASARAAARGAEGVSLEVLRQLPAMRRAMPSPVPEDFSPSYKSCVDVATNLSRARTLPHVLLALGLPIALVVVLRALTRSEPASLVVDALVSFVAAAGFTGFAAGLTLDAAHSAVAGRRLKRAPDGGVVPLAAAGEALTAVFGHAAGPAALALALATACVALAIAPFLN